MDSNIIEAAVIALIGGILSAPAWTFYQSRAKRRERDEGFIRTDYKERMIRLESLLEKSSQEKDAMRSEILRLSNELSVLKTKVEFLEKENNDLKSY